MRLPSCAAAPLLLLACASAQAQSDYPAEIDRILKMPDIREKLLAQGFEMGGGSPEQFDKFLNSEIDRWGRIVKASGARVD